MLCPNCMSPYVEPYRPEEEGEGETVAQNELGEPFFHCTECEYVAPRSEFLPETDR